MAIDVFGSGVIDCVVDAIVVDLLYYGIVRMSLTISVVILMIILCG
jgi:hypothetical protein